MTTNKVTFMTKKKDYKHDSQNLEILAKIMSLWVMALIAQTKKKLVGCVL